MAERVEEDQYYFKKQANNNVTLYQDADTPQMALFDDIKYEDGTTHQATRCWKDLYNALNDAKRLIYITGWSVSTKITLVRDEQGAITLGELLKKKADQGVTVLVLLWTPGYGTKDFATLELYDTETIDFFKDTKVHVERVSWGISTHAIANRVYSQHQKSVIVDADHPTDKTQRRLMTFLGGLDLTKGRYDTPDHTRWSTLNGVHCHDFYQNIIDTKATVGPRQPWHDIHCRIEGPVAYQVLQNFEERVQRLGSNRMNRKLVQVVGRKSGFDLICPGEGVKEEMWQCQLLRSITDYSASLKREREHTLEQLKGLVYGYTLYDDSIQRAYISHIKNADKFIYIENQYFIGSCSEWSDHTNAGADNKIPLEITDRIQSKIKAGEPFAVYIVIPMLPEGKPDSKAIQKILYYQNLTISFMYKKIAKTLWETKTKARPTDYLNFYCLGKRTDEAVSNDLEQPETGSLAAKTRETLRFMVYVHAKMMIVDDSHIIVGSANTNERSMNGTRDTEIAVSSHQEKYICKNGVLPRGRVSGFRKAVWAEHMQVMEHSLDDPSTVECVTKVNQIAEQNWAIYSIDYSGKTQGHLLSYPYHVAQDGAVYPRCELFPDVGGKISGTYYRFMPDIIVTNS